MFDIQKTFDWLDRVCSRALETYQCGDRTLLDALSASPTLASYLGKVVIAERTNREGWMAANPRLMIEADTIRQAYEDEANGAAGLDRLLALVNAERPDQDSLDEDDEDYDYGDADD